MVTLSRVLESEAVPKCSPNPKTGGNAAADIAKREDLPGASRSRLQNQTAG